jgi:hypothetical protein
VGSATAARGRTRDDFGAATRGVKLRRLVASGRPVRFALPG